jgi:hypothetical protein
VAVGQTILVSADHLRRDGTVSHDLGPHSCDARDRRAVERRLVHRLEGMGDTVSLEPAAEAAGERYFQTTLGDYRKNRICRIGADYEPSRAAPVIGAGFLSL